MDKVEMKPTPPNRHEKEQHCQVDRMLVKAHEWNVSVGEAPEQKDFESSPDRNGRSESPNEIIDVLISKEKS